MNQPLLAAAARRGRSSVRVQSVLGMVMACLVATGCLRAQAKALPVVPLDVPEAPERVVDVRDPQEPPIIPLPEEPPRNTPVMPRLTPPPRVDSRPAEPRPEPETPRAPEEPARPSPTLQTTPTQQETEAERRVRTMLAQATTDLNRINVRTLNADAKFQFDTARRFVTQADEALKARNLVFATNLAEKAVALAGQLSGR